MSADLIGHIKFLPWGQLDGCSVTRPFLSLGRVWLARLCTHSANWKLHWDFKTLYAIVNCYGPVEINTCSGVFPLHRANQEKSANITGWPAHDYRIPRFLWRERPIKVRSPYPHCEQWRTHIEMSGCNLGSQQLENRHTAPCKNIHTAYIQPPKESWSCFVKLELSVN